MERFNKDVSQFLVCVLCLSVVLVPIRFLVYNPPSYTWFEFTFLALFPSLFVSGT